MCLSKRNGKSSVTRPLTFANAISTPAEGSNRIGWRRVQLEKARDVDSFRQILDDRVRFLNLRNREHSRQNLFNKKKRVYTLDLQIMSIFNYYPVQRKRRCTWSGFGNKLGKTNPGESQSRTLSVKWMVWKCLVCPGVLLVLTTVRPMMLLMSELFPTLG